MKAKSKRDNKIYDVQVHGRNQDDVPLSYCTPKFDKFFLPEELDFNFEEDNKKLDQCNDYWFKYRVETARMILSGLISSNETFENITDDNLVDTSLRLTDKLIKQLSSNV